jgi:hypothetical protein
MCASLDARLLLLFDMFVYLHVREYESLHINMSHQCADDVEVEAETKLSVQSACLLLVCTVSNSMHSDKSVAVALY